MRRLAQMRLAACQIRNKACWTSGRVSAWTRVLRGGLHLFCMVEEPHRVRAIVAGRGCKGIKQLALLLDRRCLTILREHVLK
jgi:hypothetical protein